ncbi:hypothetical protein HYH02_008317 [Chlamydomonas schloesseri]|uniref:Uncharacterized protein n=1 Tax=Chlamydomonas schloesseri TaxID=2026947 RepID=A0A835WG29_9CHLO|nr:hypothetical protein HYH02_008317 [Chlamydomonas schloesseri]|eukprot:KAG2446756.1 hypothetical protein HYH02_008317 [Chlamydomonas schloesseri]
MQAREQREVAETASTEAAAVSRRAQRSAGLLGYLVPSFLFSSASDSKLQALGGEAVPTTGGSAQRGGLPTASASFPRPAASPRTANAGMSAPPSPSHANGGQPRVFMPHRLDRGGPEALHSPAHSRLAGGGPGGRQPPHSEPQLPQKTQQHDGAAAAAALGASPATSGGGAWGSRCPSVAGADVAGGGDPGGVNHGHHSHGNHGNHGRVSSTGGNGGTGMGVSPADPDRASAVRTRGAGPGAGPGAGAGAGVSTPCSVQQHSQASGSAGRGGAGGSGTGARKGDGDGGSAAATVGGGAVGIGAAVMDSVRRSISSGMGAAASSAPAHSGGDGGRGAGNPSGKPPVRAGTAPGAVGAASAGSSQPQPQLSLFGMPLPLAPASAGGVGGSGSSSAGIHPGPPPISVPGLNHRVRAASPKPRRVPSLSGPMAPNGPGLGSSAAAAPKQAAATSAAAAARPSPGALIRYVLAPALLLPVAWPWLLLRLWYVALCTAGVLAGAVIDAVGALVDLLRRHRSGAELLGGWAVAWLGWLLAAYWAGLAQLQLTAEDALTALSKVAAPLAAALLRRYPALSAALQPLQAAAGAVTASAYGAFCFVHDEIVPVALDLAERLPLVHMLLHRAVTSG